MMAGNQDLLRASIRDLEAEAIAKALQWLDGQGPYPLPTSIHFNLTLRCSARCSHCRQWSWPPQGELSIPELERLFGIFKSWGVQTVTFGGGNPLLHHHVCQALVLAKEHGIHVGIVSEGIDLTDELSEAICRCAEWIRFSLDGPTAEIHDSIRNKPGLFQTVLQSIRRLKARSSPLRVGMNCVVQKANIHSLPQMIPLAEQAGIDALLFKVPHGDDPTGSFLPSTAQWRGFVEWVRNWAPDRARRFRTNLEELKRILGPVFREGDVVRGRPVQSFHAEQRVRCFAPFFFLACDSLGNMFPCDYLQADTREWGGRFGRMRQEFCLGNVLGSSHEVLVRLAEMMRGKLHHLPANGHPECGCCTRFCQLNCALSGFKPSGNTSDAKSHPRPRCIEPQGVNRGSPFL